MTALVDIKTQAHGRWPSILTNFGIDSSLLDGGHHQCPVCGGTDRFRFDDKNGNGDWVCSGHGMRRGASVGAGNGIDLLMSYLGKGFREVADEIRQALLGQLPKVERPYVSKAPVDRQEVLSKLNKLLAKSHAVVGNDPVDRYLKLRGLSEGAPAALRYVPSLGYFTKGKEGPELKGHFPAMIAQITDVEGNLLAIHRTYLAAKGNGKAPVDEAKKLSNKGIMGGAIRLFEPKDGFIAITEGIETALAVHELFGWPTWATVATAFMSGVELPKHIDKIVICADFDKIDPLSGARPGHVAAMALREKLRAEGRTVKIMLPPREGMDFLDELVERNNLNSNQKIAS